METRFIFDDEEIQAKIIVAFDDFVDGKEPTSNDVSIPDSWRIARQIYEVEQFRGVLKALEPLNIQIDHSAKSFKLLGLSFQDRESLEKISTEFFKNNKATAVWVCFYSEVSYKIDRKDVLPTEEP